MDDLTSDQLAACKEAFTLFDKDGDGSLTFKELGIVMRELGYNPTEEELHEMIQEVDDEGKGSIDYDEFLTIMAKKMKDVDTEKGTLEAFKVFDKEKNGFISASELKYILVNLGEGMNEQEAEELMHDADLNTDGQIDYTDFVKSLFNNL